MGFEDLVERLHHAALDPKVWTEFARAYEGAVEGTALLLALPAPTREAPGTLIAPSLDPRFLTRYQERDFLADPWLPMLDALPVGRLAADGEMRLSGELCRGEFVRDWMAPQGLMPAPHLVLGIERDSHVGFAVLHVFQLRDRPRFGNEPRQMLERLLPHVRHAVQLQFQRAHLRAERAALAQVLDRLPLQVIVVDADGRVHTTNTRAARRLAARETLTLERDGLGAVDPQDATQLRHAIARVMAAEAESPTEIVQLSRSEPGAPVTLVVCRLSRDDGCPARPGLAAVFVSRLGEPFTPPPGALRRLYGLTPAEARLACVLAGGQSLAEAVEVLGITAGTARQRLSQVFAKTGVFRQAALVHLLLTGPAGLLGEATEDASPRSRTRAAAHAEGQSDTEEGAASGAARKRGRRKQAPSGEQRQRPDHRPV